MALSLPPLYPIVDLRETTTEAVDRAERLAGTLAAAGATLLQLRAKSLAVETMTAMARRLVAALDQDGCRLIVNDRADVAAASGAYGVHLGDTDLPVDAARQLLGTDAIIGFSTHDPDEVRSPSARGADYLGFGPVFESPTKAGIRNARGVEQLASACRATDLPVVAIGGVTLATAPDIWAAGATCVAVISEIERSARPAELIDAYRASRTTASYSDG